MLLCSLLLLLCSLLLLLCSLMSATSSSSRAGPRRRWASSVVVAVADLSCCCYFIRGTLPSDCKRAGTWLLLPPLAVTIFASICNRRSATVSCCSTGSTGLTRQGTTTTTTTRTTTNNASRRARCPHHPPRHPLLIPASPSPHTLTHTPLFTSALPPGCAAHRAPTRTTRDVSSRQACKVVWEGFVVKPHFKNFRVEAARTADGARKVLEILDP